MVHNFNAGPAQLPKEVVARFFEGALDFKNTGMSIFEISHRSQEVEMLVKEMEDDLRVLFNISAEYSVIFMPAGGTAQFSAVPLNLGVGCDIDYIVTGAWSDKAATEAMKYAKSVNTIDLRNIISNPLSTTEAITTTIATNCNPNAAYLYYCDNETIDGIEFPFVPNTSNNLVCDMSSNFGSRVLDISKFGCIFATAQKNIGAAGVTVVIIENAFLNMQRKRISSNNSSVQCPSILCYSNFISTKSLYNTPDTASFYINSLTIKWILSHQSGDKSDSASQIKSPLEVISDINNNKAQLIYNLIDTSEGFYTSNIRLKTFRSYMNIVFRLKTESLEQYFLEKAGQLQFIGLKGHRSVGGIRVSLYNAVSIQSVTELTSFMSSFMNNAA